MKKTYFIIIIFLLSINIIVAQTYSTKDKKAIKFYKKAERFYDKPNYDKTIIFCNKSIEIDENFIEPYILLSKTYYRLGDTDNEVFYLKKSLEIYPEQEAVVLTIANIEFEREKYKEAQKYYDKYLKFKHIENRKNVLLKIEICKFRINAIENPVSFEPIKLPATINSTQSEYFPSLTPDENTLIFTRQDGIQEDLYVSYKNDTSWTEAKSISSNINTDKNEGASSISADGSVMLLTRCLQREGCDIFLTYIENNDWIEPYKIGNSINSTSWDSQPCISADGNTIYFVSTRPGGMGGIDIWKIERKKNGAWSNAINLGATINTKGNETSPFIHPDNQTLYFSSNFWTGMGGMDLFLSRKNKKEEWGTPQNIGYPINTKQDERRIIVNTKGDLAYFSSDRDGLNQHDLFQFYLPKESQAKRTIYVKAKIFDAETNKRITANYEIINLKNNKLTNKDSIISEFIVCLPTDNDYLLNVAKNGYLFYSENFSLKDLSDTINFYNIDIYMKPIKIGEKIVLKNIFFETDSYKIKEKSFAELDKLVSFLRLNPTIKIEIGGHTDNVGTKKHNDELSENRAKSVKEYLVNKEIKADRISYKGYGFSQPIASNKTKQGRSQNRRTEFKVTN